MRVALVAKLIPRLITNKFNTMYRSNKSKKFGLVVKELTTPFHWILLHKSKDFYWIWRRAAGLNEVPESYFHAEFASAKLTSLPRVFDVMKFVEIEDDDFNLSTTNDLDRVANYLSQQHKCDITAQDLEEVIESLKEAKSTEWSEEQEQQLKTRVRAIATSVLSGKFFTN
jgi:hypothetical protein